MGLTLFYKPGREASYILGRVSDEYCQEREEYRAEQTKSPGHIGIDALAQYDRLVSELFRKAGRLVVGEGSSSIVTLRELAKLKDSIRSKSGDTDELLTESIAYQVIEETYKTAHTMEDRIIDLILVVGEVDTSKRARRFLERVSRCYLFGFDAECVVMCRAVLDAEFQARIPADDCIDILGNRPIRNGHPMVDLTDRISVAVNCGIISSNCGQIAHAIRKIGNDVVHGAPAITSDALAIITRVIDVLREMDGGPDKV
jgi:Domain of unknown function (DUF4145)